MKNIRPFVARVTRTIQNKVATIINREGADYIMWGKDNLLPQEIITALMGSGTARRCIEKREAYIEADGFTDESAAKFMVNPTQTADEFLSEIANHVATLRGFACVVKYDPLTGKPAAIYSRPIDKIRKNDKGMFVYNPMTTGKWDKKDDQVLNPFDPTIDVETRKRIIAEDMQKHKSQCGELLFVFRKRIGEEHYPIPEAYSGIEDIKTDAELSSFEYDTVANGFFPASILTLLGEYDDQDKDEKTQKTELEELRDKLKEFTAQGEGNGTSTGRQKLLVLFGKNKEEIPDLKPFNQEAVFNALEKITDRIGRKVCRLLGVTPILAGFEDSAILGNSEAFKNALISLQSSVLKDQNMISQALKKVFPEVDWTISTLDLVKFIPATVMAKMTDDEIRAIAGLPPIEKQTSEGTEKTLQTLNTMSPIVANKVLNSMGDEEIRALVGLIGPKPLTATDDPDALALIKQTSAS